MTEFKPSKYQQDIYNFISKKKGNAIIQAVAGSGKTTTIVKATKLIPKNERSIFVAFNKAIADELRRRLDSNIEVRTLHSFGLSLFTDRPEVKFDKLDNIIKMVLAYGGIDDNDKLFFMYRGRLKRVVSLVKAELTDYENYGAINDLIIRRGFDFDLDDKLFGFIKQIMIDCKQNVKTIDFDDMIYLPIVLNFDNKKYDWVFVDEVQDLNKSQFELIKKMCNGGTNVIAVGDRRQSIYAFRGADTLSMDNFKVFFKATELPLSICYRCPKLHIDLAKEIVPEIECSDNAIDGIFDTLEYSKAIEKASDGDLILCRTNAPLIGIAFDLIRAGKKAIIRGRNIGTNLITMINKYKVRELKDLVEKVINFQQLQEEKLALIDKGQMDFRRKNSFMVLVDSCEVIRFIAEEVETINELKDKIQNIFRDDIVGIVCSSIHKAKGLEADRVFILQEENMPHPMAKTEEEVEQEYNIRYVALTRSKKELYFINEEVE